MLRFMLPTLLVSVLAACGGGGGGAAPDPQVASSTQPATASTTPAPASGGTGAVATTPATQSAQPSGGSTTQAQPVVQPQAPQPDPVAVASASCTYKNAFGATFPCDPRWPHPGQRPPNGSTQDEVDGYNAMCSTVTCTIVLCPNGQVVGLSEAFGVCPVGPGGTREMMAQASQ